MTPDHPRAARSAAVRTVVAGPFPAAIVPAPDGRAALLATLTEAQWQRQVVEWATRAGWRVFHAYDSRRSAGGFPDLVLVKPGCPVIFAELKTISGRVSPQQRIWLDDLAMSSGAVFACVWRPSYDLEVKSALSMEPVG